MSLFYKKYIFICTNVRKDKNKRSCGNENTLYLKKYMKEKIKEEGLKEVRVNSAGCLNRCKKGPLMVIYPKGVWLKFKNKSDIDLIIKACISEDKDIESLTIKN